MALAVPRQVAPDAVVLGGELCELAAHVHSAHAELALRAAAFDAAGGWCDTGIRSCAHWLAIQAGLDLHTSRDLLRSLDQMVWAVNPRNDTVEHLVVYLCRYASEYFQDTSILCELRVPQELPTLPLSAEIRHNLFLAFEEALTNAMKHSAANRLVIEVLCEKNSLQVIVRDNGRGFEPEKLQVSDSRNSRVGQGLPGLQRRLNSLAGECIVRSTVGKGTTVVLKIPLVPQKAPL